MSEVHKPHDVSSRRRVPTEKQYLRMQRLGVTSALLSQTKRDTEPLLRNGWVTAEAPTNGDRYYQFVRLTPEGLRALGDAAERYGLPELFPATVRRRYCSDCGSGRHHYEVEEVEGP